VGAKTDDDPHLQVVEQATQPEKLVDQVEETTKQNTRPQVKNDPTTMETGSVFPMLVSAMAARKRGHECPNRPCVSVSSHNQRDGHSRREKKLG
jgi:hypothetical protein